MSYAQERTDIESRLNANWTTTSIAWGNIAFIPTIGTAWIRCTILPGDANGLSFGRDTNIEYAGIIDIGIFTPKDSGNNIARTYADTIAAIFNMQNFGTVDCDEAFARNLGIEESWYNWNVTVPYFRIE